MLDSSYFIDIPIGPDTRIDCITASANGNQDDLQRPQTSDFIERLDPRWLVRKKDKSAR